MATLSSVIGLNSGLSWYTCTDYVLYNKAHKAHWAIHKNKPEGWNISFLIEWTNRCKQCLPTTPQ